MKKIINMTISRFFELKNLLLNNSKENIKNLHLQLAALKQQKRAENVKLQIQKLKREIDEMRRM